MHWLARSYTRTMPFYEYECPHCRQTSEVLQKISDPPLKKCTNCGKSGLKRLISAPVFRLKGSGWYETDFKSDKENKRNLVGSDTAPKSDSKPEAKPEDKAAAKPESTAEPKTESKSESKLEPKASSPAAASPAARAKPAKRRRSPTRRTTGRRR
jgi:putative FmdB family regulatory protein